MPEAATNFRALVRQPKNKGTFKLWRARRTPISLGTQVRLHGLVFDLEGVQPTSTSMLFSRPSIRHDVEQKFQRLAQQWRAETQHLSSITDKTLHPSYLRIIGMGPAVVPLLLRELQHAPDHWFAALSVITDADPVGPNGAGTFAEMTDKWIAWGRANRYI